MELLERDFHGASCFLARAQLLRGEQTSHEDRGIDLIRAQVAREGLEQRAHLRPIGLRHAIRQPSRAMQHERQGRTDSLEKTLSYLEIKVADAFFEYEHSAGVKCTRSARGR